MDVQPLKLQHSMELGKGKTLREEDPAHTGRSHLPFGAELGLTASLPGGAGPGH